MYMMMVEKPSEKDDPIDMLTMKHALNYLRKNNHLYQVIMSLLTKHLMRGMKKQFLSAGFVFSR
jgi:hypothetical protein